MLLNTKHFNGAYYLAGYAVECALKACIAKRTSRYDFPDKRLAHDSYTHNLSDLLGIAGLRTKLEADAALNQSLRVNWSVVKDWSERSRYDAAVPQQKAKDLYSACTSRPNGVLAWIRQSW